MGNYFTDTIFKVDIALAVLAILLIAAIFFYDISRIYLDNHRLKRLQKIKKNVYRIVLTEKELSKNDILSSNYCSLPTFLDVATNRVKEGVFFNEAEQEVFKKLCITEKGIKKALSTAARSLSKWRRIEAMLFLGYAKVDGAFAILKNGLASKDEDISYFAAVALAQIRNSDSAKALLQFLKRKPGFRYKTASLLEQFPKEISRDVIKLADDKDYSVRFLVPQIIAGLGDSSCIDKIKGLLSDEYPAVRASACKCLGYLGGKSNVDVLKKSLKDENWFVREQVLESLDGILDVACVPLVIELIKDNSWIVIERLKKILAKNIETSLPYLEKFLSGKDELTKKIAMEIIELSGCIKKLYEDLLDGKKESGMAISVLKTMMAMNAKGLEPDLYGFNAEAQKKIYEILHQN